MARKLMGDTKWYSGPTVCKEYTTRIGEIFYIDCPLGMHDEILKKVMAKYPEKFGLVRKPRTGVREPVIFRQPVKNVSRTPIQI